jgi:hypothetical protein
LTVADPDLPLFGSVAVTVALPSPRAVASVLLPVVGLRLATFVFEVVQLNVTPLIGLLFAS